jgi:DNA gyrase subunit A
MNEKILNKEITNLFKTKYAMFAISSNARSIPSAKDGFKPVHRRILYQAKQTAPSSRGTVKSASIVGGCLANYHPHGDSSVYDAMCRMARVFVNQLPYIQSHGNVGAIDGSNAAAQRYTECKLHPNADWMVIEGVDDGAVPFDPNYDNRLKEPRYLPVKLPNLLLNGVPGGSIGVGYASQIPPHNPIELVNASKYVLACLANGEEPSLDELLTYMPGPDFPTGALISSPIDIKNAYATGQGILKIRSRSSIETNNRSSQIIINEIPFGLTTDILVQDITDAATGRKDNKTKQKADPLVPEIKDVRDETAINKQTKLVEVRLVIDLKAGENPDIVLEKLFKFTKLETSFSVNMIALDEQNRPILFNLIDAIIYWADFRSDCIKRQASYELEKYREREHVIQGLLKAIPNIDRVVKIIKEAKTEESASLELCRVLKITSKQAEAILAMQLKRLTNLRSDELKNEAVKLGGLIEYRLKLLTDPLEIILKIDSELDSIIQKLNYPRKTDIINLGTNLDAKLLVPSEDCLVSITGQGYLKRFNVNEFRTQLKGGRGRKGAKTKKDDILLSLISCHSHDRLFAITNNGAVIRLEAHEIPIGGSSAGRHAANLGFQENELVCSILQTSLPIPEESQAVFGAIDGSVKRVLLSDLTSKMRERLVFYKKDFEHHDIIGGIHIPDEEASDIFLASASGLGTRFSPSEVRLTNRNGCNVKGMNLNEQDYLVSIGAISNPESLILCITSDGIGKRVGVSEFPSQNRGGKGRILIRLHENAILVQALIVTELDNVLIATKDGHTLRIQVDEIRQVGRNTSGSRLIKLNEGDYVVSAVIIPD